MKKKILLLMGIFSLGLLQAQVGINTTNPQGMFHIDTKGDTNGTTNISDDVIINSAGNLGVGVINPTAKIHIKSGDKSSPKQGFRLEDGTEAVTRVLMSDNEGNATWKDSRLTGVAIGSFGDGAGLSLDIAYSGIVSGVTVEARPGNKFIKSTGQITLTRGTWWVKVSLYVGTWRNDHNAQVWIRTSLADDLTVNNATPRGQYSADLRDSYTLASSLIWQNAQGGVIYGSFLLDNLSSTPKTYYLMAGWTGTYDSTLATVNTIFRVGNSGAAENALIGYRIN